MQIESEVLQDSKKELNVVNNSKDQVDFDSRKSLNPSDINDVMDKQDIMDGSKLLLTDPQVMNFNPRGSHNLDKSFAPYEKDETTITDENFKEKMNEIQNLDGQVKDGLEGIEEKLNNMQEFHETDFLRAYKDQMFVLKKELKHLKDKLGEETLKRQRDEKVQFYMQERDYFRAQALRLESEKNGYIKDINNLKMKLLTIKDDKKYFETFVIEARKENKDLKDEIRQVHEQYEKQLVQHAKNDYYNKFTLGKKVKPTKEVDFELLEKDENDSLFDEIVNNEGLSNNAKAMNWKNRYMKEKAKCLKTSKKLKEICGNKTDLIYIMQNCVAEVKRDIYFRKFANKDSKGKTSNDATDRLISQYQINEDVNLNHFSNVDKKAQVNNLLSHEEMINILEKFQDQLGFNERREEFLTKNHHLNAHPFKHPFSDRHLMDTDNLKTSETQQSGMPKLIDKQKNDLMIKNANRPITASTTTNLKGIPSRPTTAQTTYSKVNLKSNSRVRYGRVKFGPTHGSSIKAKDVAGSGFESQTTFDKRINSAKINKVLNSGLFFEMKV